MENSELNTQANIRTIGLREFLPGLFSFLRRLPGFANSIRKLKRMKPGFRNSMGSYIEENAVKYADVTALEFEEERYTHREFNERANRVANYFQSRGVQKGDVVVLLLDNRPELLFCIAGLGKIGAIASLVNPNLRGAALEHCVSIKPAISYIIDENLVDVFEEIRSNIEMHPNAEIYFSVNHGKKGRPRGYADLKEKTDSADMKNPTTTESIEIQDPLCYVFTSGTTGKPKAAVIDHHRWIKSKMAFGAEMALKPDDKIYIPLPFSHSTALQVAWAPAVHAGATTVMRRKFSVSNFWDDVNKYNVTAFGYIGELCRYLMNQPPQAGDNQNSVKKIIGNGLRPDIWKDFKKRFGIKKVYEFYASSEGNVVFTNMMNLDCTIGFGMTPYTIVKYDIKADRPIIGTNGFMQKAKKGEAGLLLGKITEENRLPGYTDSNATESKILRDVFEKGDAWFNTGDLLKNIGFGHVQFVDRLGDTFRWKGENVSTTEVEEIISTQDQIKESTVYGVTIPHTEGRAGMVSLISNTDLRNFDFKAFVNRIRHDLPSYAVPIFIRFQEEFGVTHTMKRVKSQLKREGFDPQSITDPLYVMLPGETSYTPLTKELYTNISGGKYRF